MSSPAMGTFLSDCFGGYVMPALILQPKCAAASILGGPRSGPTSKAPLPGLTGKRMMGLEPTTFCMASRRSSQLSYIRERRQV